MDAESGKGNVEEEEGVKNLKEKEETNNDAGKGNKEGGEGDNLKEKEASTDDLEENENEDDMDVQDELELVINDEDREGVLLVDLLSNKPEELGMPNNEVVYFQKRDTEKREEDDQDPYCTPTGTGKRLKKDQAVSPTIMRELLNDYWEITDKLCQRSEEMVKLVEKNPKTKIAIKEKAKEMNNIAKRLKKIRENLKEVPRVRSEVGVEIETISINSEGVFFSVEGNRPLPLDDTPRHHTPQQNIVDTLGTEQERMDSEMIHQKEEPIYCEKCNKMVNEEKMRISEILGGIEQIRKTTKEDLERGSLKELVDKEWPEQVYSRTIYCEGEILKQPEGTKVIIVPEEETSKLLKMGKNWIDEMVDEPGILKKASEISNKPILCEKKSKYRVLGEEENREGTEKKVYVLAIQGTQQNEELENTYMAIKTITQNLEAGEETCAMVVGVKELQNTRKLIELASEQNFIRVIQPTKKKTGSNEAHTIYVRADPTQQKTFADFVRDVKTVNPDLVDAKIKTMRRARDGSVMLLTDGRNTEKLRAEIATKVDGARATVGGRMKIEVLDLDPTSTKEDITEEVFNLLSPVEREEIVVEDPRLTTSGFQISYVNAPREIGDKLLNIGTVMIGWTSCRMREKVAIDRCNNCLQLGHIARNCRQQIEKDIRCLRCAGAGHVAKDCEREKFCVSCNLPGHRSDSYSCPHYRELVNARRNRNNYDR